jgi:hypothetical protein
LLRLLDLLLGLLHLRGLGHELRSTESLLLGRALRRLPLREATLGLAGVRGSSGRIAGRLIHRDASSFQGIARAMTTGAYPKAAG